MVKNHVWTKKEYFINVQIKKVYHRVGFQKKFQSAPDTLVRCKTKEEINKKNFIIFLFPLLFFVKHKCPYMIKSSFPKKIMWTSIFIQVWTLIFMCLLVTKVFEEKNLVKWSYKPFVKLKFMFWCPPMILPIFCKNLIKQDNRAFLMQRMLHNMFLQYYSTVLG